MQPERVPPIVSPKTGEFWYRFDDPKGKPIGFGRLVMTRPPKGGLSVTWENKQICEGGTYEEDRTLVLDSRWRMLSASHSEDGKILAEGRREGSRWIGVSKDRTNPEGPGEKVDIPLTEDAASAMQFVLLAGIPLESGVSIPRTEHNDFNAYRQPYPVTLRCLGPETLQGEGRDLPTFHMALERGQNILNLWVNAQREIVKIDWGEIGMMVLSLSPTRHLFRPGGP